jgi:hypothetical protein
MPWRKTLTTGLGVMLCLLVGWGSGLAGKESALVPAETVVDYIHAVLTSDRTFYTVHVVEGMQRRGVIESSEQWRVADLEAWMREERAKLSRHSEAAKAMDYNAQTLAGLHSLPPRRPHLPEQPRRRAGAARHRAPSSARTSQRPRDRGASYWPA